MDMIWYRNPSKSEVIGRSGGMKKTNDHAEPTNSRTLKIKKITLAAGNIFTHYFTYINNTST